MSCSAPVTAPIPALIAVANPPIKSDSPSVSGAAPKLIAPIVPTAVAVTPVNVPLNAFDPA